MADVFLHVGLPKTGTTTIQAALEASIRPLADAGVLFPGGRHHAQRLAAYDLLGQRIAGDHSHVVAGAFGCLLEEMQEYEGRSIVVSEEELALARPRHVRRLLRGLEGHRVFVVVGIRDIARTLVSAWQQSVVMGGTTTWRDFSEAVREHTRGDVASGAGFWIRHDPLHVLDTWGAEVPPERIRVLTVPPPGSRSTTLLDRFAAAADLPHGILAGSEVSERNVSLGAAEVEVIRRLNAAVTRSLDKHQYRHVVEHGIRPGLKLEGSRPLRLPPEDLPWAREHGEGLVAELRRRGHPVFGDLADLAPAEAPPTGRRLDDVSEAELLEAAEAALAALALAHGRLFRRFRRAFFERQGRFPSTTELLGSSARAATFRLEKAALERANGNRALAWAVWTYLDRTLRLRRH